MPTPDRPLDLTEAYNACIAADRQKTNEINVLVQENRRLIADSAHLREQIACACNALTDSILCSGNDVETNLHWVRKLKKVIE